MMFPFGRSPAITICRVRRVLAFAGVAVDCRYPAIQSRKSPVSRATTTTTTRRSSYSSTCNSCCSFSIPATAALRVRQTRQFQFQNQNQYNCHYHNPAIEIHHEHYQDRVNYPKRKHFWSLEELRRESDQLLTYCRLGRNGLTSNCDLHYVTNTAHIFHLLEAWMEQAKAETEPTTSTGSLSRLEAARSARHILLNVLDPPVLRNNCTNNGNTPYSQYTQSDGNAKKRYKFLPQAIITSYFDVVLQAYAVCNGGEIAAEEAEALLNLMIQNCLQQAAATTNTTPKMQKGQPSSVRFAPTLKTFNIVLTCWARSGAHNAGMRAQKLVERMHTDWNRSWLPSNNRDHEIWMDERSLVSWMDAWTHSRHLQAPEQVQSLLHQALAAASNNESDNTSIFRNVNLDVAVFNATINSWVQSQRGRDAAVNAENVLRLLLQWSQTCSSNSNNITSTNQQVGPNTRTYAMIVDAWAHCSNDAGSSTTPNNKSSRNGPADAAAGAEAAAQRAQHILERMYEHYRLGNDSEARIKPNAIVVTTAIAAWSRSATHCRHAPEKAEQLWQQLYQLYQESGGNDVELAPQVETGNAVLAAWARSYRTRDDSIEGARAALLRFQSLMLVDLTSYNTILDALSRKGRGHEARQLLDWLEQQKQTESHVNPGATAAIDLTPDLISYNCVLAAIARSTDGLTTIGPDAEELLRTMERLSSTDPRRANLRPDKRSYTNVINAWARSDHPDKVQRGHALLQEMIDRYHGGDATLRPDALVLAVLLKSCARTMVAALPQENRKVLLLALQTLELLERGEFGLPNDITYATVLQTINRLTGTAQQREELLRSVFERCAGRGMVSNSVMAEMNRGGSLRLFLRLTDGKNKLQPQWSANVPTQHRPK